MLRRSGLAWAPGHPGETCRSSAIPPAWQARGSNSGERGGAVGCNGDLSWARGHVAGLHEGSRRAQRGARPLRGLHAAGARAPTRVGDPQPPRLPARVRGGCSRGGGADSQRAAAGAGRPNTSALRVLIACLFGWLDCIACVSVCLPLALVLLPDFPWRSLVVGARHWPCLCPALRRSGTSARVCV